MKFRTNGWESNVFPGVLGRTCDRPCEPACRRVRVEEEPVAICRLKRAAADNKSDITDQLPIIPSQKNGKKYPMMMFIFGYQKRIFVKFF